jgi:serine/threonine-protein kinase
MRYVEGEDLGTLLGREGALEPARALDLLSQVGEALDAAHEHGLVHRDVKPANVLVTREGDTEHSYLADFGLARSPGDLQPAYRAHLSGTVDYTAPEQIAAEPADRRADLYSLGCVLYECLAGKPPFRRDRPASTLYAHFEKPRPSLHKDRPDLPDAIDEVIAKALAKEPDDRYETCGELCREARGALGLEARRFSRRTPLLAGGVVAVAVAAAAAVPAIVLSAGRSASAVSGDPAVPLPLTEDSLVRIDSATSRITQAIPVPGAHLLAVDDNAVWIASSTEPALTRIDPRSDAVVEIVDTAELGVPGFLAADGGAVWVGRVSTPVDRLWKYDPESATLAAIPADIPPVGVATGVGSVWVAGGAALVARIDPEAGEVLWFVDLSKAGRCDCYPGAIAVGEGAVWTIGGGENADTVFRVDLQSRRTLTIPLGAPATDIAVGDGAVWVTNPDADAVSSIDAATNRIASTIRVGRIPSTIAVGHGYVWVASSRDGTVIRVDPRTADIATIDVGGTPEDIAIGDGAVWVAVNADE